MRPDLTPGSTPQTPPWFSGAALAPGCAPSERLALLLLNLAQPFEIEPGQTILTVPLAEATLAGLAGQDVFTTRHLLAGFAEAGLLTRRGQRFIVWDQGGLARVALGG